MPPISKNMGNVKPFQLLEINIISAQDLEPTSKKMKTYATAWVHPERKLTTGVDGEGGNNPTWNDKFVFRVDEEFLRQDTAAVHIEIYSVHWFRDSLVGTVRVLVGNLIPPIRNHIPNHHLGMRFVALQIRRPSGRPQGILNIGVTLLDSSMRSMPLYRQMSSSAVGFRNYMEQDAHFESKQNNATANTNNNNGTNNNNNNNNNVATLKPILRRTRSERSERVTFDDISMANSSLVAPVPSKKKSKAQYQDKESSILSISFEPPAHMMNKKKGKASSVISGAELREKPKSSQGKNKGKASSVLSDSIVSKGSSCYDNKPNNEKPKPKLKLIELEIGKKDEPIINEKPKPGADSPTTKVIDEQSVTKVDEKPKETQPIIPIVGKPIGHEYGGPRGPIQNGKSGYGGGPLKANSIWSESEIGPSASEVAAVMAEKRYPLMDDKKSSVLDGWSLDESTEGLRTKLERWRTEIPPIYDRGMASSSYRSTGRHPKKHSGGGSSLFSCFGNICGFECQCICGKPQRSNNNNNNKGKYRSPSTASRSWL